MQKKEISTPNAPKPVGPYSQAVCVDGWLFVSGQIPLDPSTGELVEGSFKEKVERVLENIKAIIEAAGGSLSDVVKVTVYLTDITRFSEFNEVYAKYFDKPPLPARVVVGVSALPKGVELEVEAMAHLSKCP